MCAQQVLYPDHNIPLANTSHTHTSSMDNATDGQHKLCFLAALKRRAHILVPVGLHVAVQSGAHELKELTNPRLKGLSNTFTCKGRAHTTRVRRAVRCTTITICRLSLHYFPTPDFSHMYLCPLYVYLSFLLIACGATYIGPCSVLVPVGTVHAITD